MEQIELFFACLNLFAHSVLQEITHLPRQKSPAQELVDKLTHNADPRTIFGLNDAYIESKKVTAQKKKQVIDERYAYLKTGIDNLLAKSAERQQLETKLQNAYQQVLESYGVKA